MRHHHEYAEKRFFIQFSTTDRCLYSLCQTLDLNRPGKVGGRYERDMQTRKSKTNWQWNDTKKTVRQTRVCKTQTK